MADLNGNRTSHGDAASQAFLMRFAEVRPATDDPESRRQAIETLSRSVRDLSRQTMALHRAALAAVDALARDVERLKRQLSKLNTART